MSQLAEHTHTAVVGSSGGQGEAYASGVVSLPVTASAKIATSVAVNASNTPEDHAVLGPTGSPLAKAYSEPGAVADLTIGSEGAVTGVATGLVKLPVTGSGGINAVVIKSTGGSAPMPVEGPRLAMHYCIVVDGIYPPRG
ncbi:hypothetical protein [Marinomonas sp. FW-1]|uniref:hypothetical protein n=1 Tax=Marinomonas sp. FW-1 TaxID=2071621 RepID=UPI0010C14594|nr:hypothetical protein [Marinomonas sp. FW-1]